MTYDLSISALVTRESLGLGDLNINDHSKYVVVGPPTLGGIVQWDKKQVSSPAADGEFTVNRRRTNVIETVGVYVAGSTIEAMFTNIRELIAAFVQHRYTLQLNIGGAVNQWDCEAAEYSVLVDTPHMVAKYGVVTLMIPRKPIPLAGGY